MEKKEYYVTLTGGKNNAGDFLIKHRAFNLLKLLRTDRDVVDVDGWKPFNDKELDLVNKSKGLILLGGPALQEKMRPRVYGLTNDLDEIKAPVIAMGIGWYSQQGRWEHTHDYPFNDMSIELLDRVAKDGYFSSVRDYHTLNTLAALGYHNYLMTGCPALYSPDHIGLNLDDKEIKKIGFSLGVSLKYSTKMEQQMKDAILQTKSIFKNAEVELVFHHGIGDNYLNSAGVAKPLYDAQLKFIKWLDKNSINYVDISGSADNLIDYYNTVDLHIGYRVHAHIYCCSISKPSIMLNEDGRGIALREVIGGVTLDMYSKTYDNLAVKASNKLGFKIDNMIPAKNVIKDFKSVVEYEINNGVKLEQPRMNIDLHYSKMKQFICQLP